MTADDITRLVRQKLQRFADCAEDSDGCDIGRDWFDALTTIGLLERTKRSPAEWMMTSAGHDALALQQGKAGGVPWNPLHPVPFGANVVRLLCVDAETGTENRVFAAVPDMHREQLRWLIAIGSDFIPLNAHWKPAGWLPLIDATPPAHSPDAGVTDEMARSAESAYGEITGDCMGLVRRKAMRAALTTALAPQPKDAER